MEFRKVVISEVAEVVGGGTPSTKNEEYYGEEIPWITPKDLSGYNKRYISRGERSITELGLKKSSAKLLPTNTVLLTSRAPIGYVAIASNEVTTNQGFKSLVCDEMQILPKYMYYIMKTSKERLESIATGSTFKEVSGTMLKNFEILIPDIKNQKKIVGLLSDLDEKIEVNTEMVKKLEEISNSIFKAWFIDFDFPNEQGLPYRSSGGEMVERELGEIPKGWEIGKIKDVCILETEKVNLDKSTETFDYIGLEHMPQGSIALANWESSEKVSGNKSVFNKGDFLFGKLRPYFKKVGIASISGVCSTDILVLQAKSLNEYAFLINHLTQDKFIDYTTSTATGTRMPRSGWNQVSNYAIVIPSKEVLEEFNEKVLPMLVMIQELVHEINNLKELRDTLLPKLLSGEIEIPDESVVERL